MNKQFGRLLLASVCGLIVALAARGADESPRPSHRLLEDVEFGNLSQAEDLLARRLGHTEDFQKLQELIKELKGVKPGDVKKLEDAIKNNPGLLDSDAARGLIEDVEKFKHNGVDLPQTTKNEAIRWAKTLLDKSKTHNSLENPVTGGSPDETHPTLGQPHDLETPSPPALSEPDGPRNHFVQGMTTLFKKIESSAEGQELRKALLKDLGKKINGPSKSSDMVDLFQNLLSPEQAVWLTNNLKLPALSKFDGGSLNSSSPVGSLNGGASSGGGLDALVWVIAFVLFGVAAWLTWRGAKRQANDGRAKAWSAGAWPVHPSRVFTREDLVRAYEHLAFLRLGLAARHLNHLDVAGRLGPAGGPARRLAHLYEQARYAPPDELLPADELSVARGDLSTLAGAAA